MVCLLQLEPVNTCNINGVNGNQSSRTISISRPAPTLAINSSDVIICSGSTTHSITGIPSGATVQWSIDNTTDASITNTTSSTVTLTRLTTSNSFVNLKATVTHCSFTYTIQKQITLGSLYSTHNIIAHYPTVEGSCFSTNSFHYFSAVFTGGFPPTRYLWAYRVTGSPLENYVALNTSTGGYFNFTSLGSYDIIVRTGNKCGFISESIRTIEVCETIGGGDYQPTITISPNPAKSKLFVKFEPEKNQNAKYYRDRNEAVYFELVNITNGAVVKKWKELFSKSQFLFNIDEIKRGQYLLIVKIGNERITKQVLIE